jgi:hypothetical protein
VRKRSRQELEALLALALQVSDNWRKRDQVPGRAAFFGVLAHGGTSQTPTTIRLGPNLASALTLRAEVNGHEGLFLFDTGEGLSTVSPEFAKMTSLPILLSRNSPGFSRPHLLTLQRVFSPPRKSMATFPEIQPP